MLILIAQCDTFLDKQVTRSAFTSTGLDQILRNLTVDGLVVIGVATNACVGMTASDAADRGYKVVIVEDATAAPSPILHELALLNFAYLFGKVRTADEILTELGLRPGARARRWCSGTCEAAPGEPDRPCAGGARLSRAPRQTSGLGHARN